jgi:hypothetical protein
MTNKSHLYEFCSISSHGAGAYTYVPDETSNSAIEPGIEFTLPPNSAEFRLLHAYKISFGKSDPGRCCPLSLAQR